MGNIKTIMLDIIILLSTNAFRTYIIYRYMRLFFAPKKEAKIRELLLYFLFFFSTFTINIIFHKPIVNVFNNIVMMLIISSFYFGAILQKSLVILLIYCIDITCEIFAVYVIHNYGTDKQFNDISPFICSLLLFLFEFIIESVFSKRIRNDNCYISVRCLCILILFPIISIFVLILILLNDLDNRPIIILSSICLLIINILVVYLYSYLISLFHRIQNHILLERQSDSYYNQLCLLTDTNKKLQSFRHDLQNHMNELFMIAKRNDTHDIVRYLESMSCSISSGEEYVNSGNPDFDSILNYLLSKANNNSCNIKCKVVVPPHLAIDLFDLNVILSNLLDNAITAASNSKLKQLSVFIRWDRNILLINVTNSYNTALKTVNHRYLTTKSDTQSHGIGLDNVKRIVDKYNGILHIEDQNNIFDVKTMLYI